MVACVSGVAQPAGQLWSEMQRLLEDKMKDIETTFRSHADFTRQEDPQHWPCCGAEQPACRCPVTGDKALHVTVPPYDDVVGDGMSPAF